MAAIESLEGGPERLLCEAVKVKPRLKWRPKSLGDSRTTGHVWRNAVYMERRCIKRLSMQQSAELEGWGYPMPLEST